jgi:CheY-like chemotaxis protein
MKYNVLVIEDQFKQISGIVRKIDRFVDSVDRATSKQEAEGYLRKNKYQLLIVDLGIPAVKNGDVNLELKLGLELIKEIRSGDFGQINKKVEYVIVTAQKRGMSDLHEQLDERCIGVYTKLDPLGVVQLINEQYKFWLDNNE